MSDREPIEIAMIALPVLIEVVCVTLFIGCMAALMIVMATPVPV